MKLILSLLLLTTLVSCSHKKHHSHSGHHKHHRFQDAKKWAKVFERKDRDKWQKPDLVIKRLGIKRTDDIADIGSATGYFPIRLAKVATKGNVYGIDIEPTLVEFLNERATHEKISNLISLLGTPHNPLIPKPVDVILTVDTYHHISKRVDYFHNLKKSLKKNGRLVIIDFKQGDFPVGPKDAMKIPQAQVIEELKKAGFSLKESHDILPYQFILVFVAS
jgi:cyclopropane fatty-acyl-phospholipid synthase-like methyltransferase